MSMKAGGSRRDVVREQRTAFVRAKAMFAAIKAAAGDPELLAKIGQYRSRGKGRGTPSRRYGNASSHVAHQGPQECLRRTLGGWAYVKATQGMTKHDYLYNQTLEF